jgi:hypothetical protein
MLDSYNEKFGFLTCTEKLHSLDATGLRNTCKNLETALIEPNMKQSDVNHEELYSEISTFLRIKIEKSMTAFQIFQYITENPLIEIFPNLFIALRVILSLPVSFSKLTLIKTYLCSRISQDRFTGLALISIENEHSRSLDYSDLID